MSTALRTLCSADAANTLVFPISSSALLRYIVQMTPIRTDGRHLRLTEQRAFNEALRDIATSWEYGAIHISDVGEPSSAGFDVESDVNVLGIDVTPRDPLRKRKRGAGGDEDGTGNEQSSGMYLIWSFGMGVPMIRT